MVPPVRFRFEHQITVLVGLLCMALMGSSIAGAVWIGERDAVAQVRRESSDLAGTMASALDTAMFERFREIQILAGLGPLRDVWRSDPGEVRHLLDTLQTSLPTYAWIGFATPDGTVQASTRKMLEGASVVGRPWFIKGLKGPTVSDVHEALLLSKLLDSAPYAEPFRFVDVSMPVYDRSHTLLGVLGAHLSWKWADELRKKLVAQMGAERHSDIWILSSDGKVLLGPKIGETPFAADQWARMRSTGRGDFESSSDAEPILTGFAATVGFQDYPGLGWVVVARRPTSVAYAPVQRTVQTILILSSLIALVAVVLTWFVARRLAAPIRQLTLAAGQIGRDPTITMLPRLGGAREFVELSSSLRSLLRRIGTAEQMRSKAEAHSNDSSRHFQQQIDDLRREAEYDPLTGLLNRRAFLAFADDAIPYFKRYGRNVAILMIDIDFFKRVNDIHGHAAGDQVLCAVAAILSASVRTTDKVSRFGGEEFVVMLREIAETDVLMIAERMRATVSAMMLESQNRTVNVTISIGAALVQTEDPDIQNIIERADQALYHAKHGGRNRVSTQSVQRIKLVSAA